MKVTRIEIENILGLERFAFEPGVVSVVEGRNGVGKTSLLESIRAALRGGEDPSLLRQGAERGFVKLSLEDGTEIVRKVGKGAGLDVRLAVSGKASTPRKLVDSLVDELGIDPLAILSCPAAKRAEYLAEVMPLEVSRADLEAAAGRRVEPIKGSALDQIETLRRLFYEERTGVNRSLKDKRTTASQLRESIPTVQGADEDLQDLRAEREALVSARATRERNAERRRDEDVTQARTHRSARQEEIRRERDEKLRAIEDDAESRITAILAEAKAKSEALRSEAGASLEAVGGEAEATIAVSEEAAREALAAIEAEYGPRAESLAARLGTAEERARQAAQHEKTRELADRLAAEADALATDAERLARTIERLDALKTSLLAQLPIPGLEISGGVVYLDGIPWERVNRARQIQVALKVARLRAGPLGLIVVDNAEALDPETFAAFEESAASTGLQFVVGRVTAGDFHVRTSAEEAA